MIPSTEPPKTTAGARLFEPHLLANDLERTSVRGAAITGGGQLCKFLLRFGSTAILARLLTPEDYGLVAMTAVIVGFAGVFKDAGLTSATVQRRDISHEQISMLFWINAAVGCLLALLLVAIAPLVAAFYDEPRLRAVTMALATTFVFGGISVQHQALLRRQMRFKALAVIEIVSMIAGIVTGVLMAYVGYGYWSLVGLSIAMSLVGAIGAWTTLRWLPGLPRRRSGAGPLLRFGGDVLSFNVVNYFSRQSDTLLIGWFWGPVALGFYDRAYNMLLLPIRQINGPLAAVAVPTLSRARSKPDQFRRFYLSSLQLVTSITVPLVVALTLYADEIVRIWLGPDWSRCAVLFRLLALAAAIGAISNPMGWLLVSLGHTRRYKQLGIFSAAVTVASFVIGLPYGAEGVAIAYSIATLLLSVPSWFFALIDSGIRPVDIISTVSPPLVSCIPATLVALLWMNVVATSNLGLFGSLVGAASFVAVYTYLLLVRFERWDHFRGLLRHFSAPAHGH